MKFIERIVDAEKNCLALIIRNDYTAGKTEFFSDPNDSLQLGMIKYSKGGVIPTHIHNEVNRSAKFTQEVLFIRKGKLRVDIFDKNKQFVISKVINQYDVLFLISGGHGFTMLEDCEMFEVKQGPYLGVEKDKTRFEGIIK